MFYWTKIHTMAAAAILLFFAGGIVLYQFVVQNSIEQRITNLQKNVEDNQKILQAKQGGTASSSLNKLSAAQLQKQLPVKPFEQQFLLEIEKAEVLSSSEVTNAAFTREELAGIAEAAEVNEDTAAEPPETVNSKSKESPEAASEETQNPPEQSKSQSPAGMKKVKATLKVESDTYEEFQQFLTSISSSERLTQVESISITGREEITSVDQTIEKLSYTVVVSAFYLPTIEALQDQLPPFPFQEAIKTRGDFENAPDSNQ